MTPSVVVPVMMTSVASGAERFLPIKIVLPPTSPFPVIAKKLISDPALRKIFPPNPEGAVEVMDVKPMVPPQDIKIFPPMLPAPLLLLTLIELVVRSSPTKILTVAGSLTSPEAKNKESAAPVANFPPALIVQASLSAAANANVEEPKFSVTKFSAVAINNLPLVPAVSATYIS